MLLHAEESVQLTNRVKNVLLSDSRTQQWEKGTIQEVDHKPLFLILAKIL